MVERLSKAAADRTSFAWAGGSSWRQTGSRLEADGALPWNSLKSQVTTRRCSSQRGDWDATMPLNEDDLDLDFVESPLSGWSAVRAALHLIAIAAAVWLLVFLRRRQSNRPTSRRGRGVQLFTGLWFTLLAIVVGLILFFRVLTTY